MFLSFATVTEVERQEDGGFWLETEIVVPGYDRIVSPGRNALRRGKNISNCPYLRATQPRVEWREVKAVWDGSSSRRDKRIQPRGFNPGKGTPLTTRPVRAQDRAWQQHREIMYLEHGSIPRSGLGPHYFLHQKLKSTFGVNGSPIAGACLFARNFESFGLCSA